MLRDILLRIDTGELLFWSIFAGFEGAGTGPKQELVGGGARTGRREHPEAVEGLPAAVNQPPNQLYTRRHTS